MFVWLLKLVCVCTCQWCVVLVRFVMLQVAVAYCVIFSIFRFGTVSCQLLCFWICSIYEVRNIRRIEVRFWGVLGWVCDASCERMPAATTCGIVLRDARVAV